MPELAIRLGRRAGDLERDQAERAAVLRRLAEGGVVDVDSVRAAISEVHREQSPLPPLH
jgi:hypothetical protein